MHSRIFQLSTEPIHTSDYISEYHYDCEHWFFDIADYVCSHRAERNSDIEWLKQCYKGITFGTDEHGEYLIVENKAEYFQPKFDKFKTVLVENFQNCTLEQFIKGYNQALFMLNDAHNDKYGFYADVSGKINMWDNEICNIDSELYTFDGFVRDAISNQKYYIGGTLDYHW